MTTRTEHYETTGRQFLARAGQYLADGDLPQASEKGWGAAAQMVKAAAEARGWPHQGHRQLYIVVDRLVAETGDRELRTLFHIAGSLHTNFYEGWLSREAVAEGLAQVEQLAQKLDSLLA